jgi:hypothetical protein
MGILASDPTQGFYDGTKGSSVDSEEFPGAYVESMGEPQPRRQKGQTQTQPSSIGDTVVINGEPYVIPEDGVVTTADGVTYNYGHLMETKRTNADLLKQQQERYGVQPLGVMSHVETSNKGGKSDPREVFLAMARKHNVAGVTGVADKPMRAKDFYPGLPENERVTVMVGGKRTEMSVYEARLRALKNHEEALQVHTLLKPRQQEINEKLERDASEYQDSRTSAQANAVFQALQGLNPQQIELLKELLGVTTHEQTETEALDNTVGESSIGIES